MTRLMIAVAMTVTLFGLVSFVGAGGGNLPSCPDPAGCPTRIVSQPTIAATFTIDPHNAAFFNPDLPDPVPAVTLTAGQAVLELRQGNRSVNAFFDIPASVNFACGCDLALMNTRFLNKPVTSFVPLFVVTDAIAALGVTPPAGNNPTLIITNIQQRRCRADGLSPAPDPVTGRIEPIDGQLACALPPPGVNPGALPGLLWFEAILQYQIDVQ
jgi:hypothetical protein